MGTDAEVETFLTGVLDEVPVCEEVVSSCCAIVSPVSLLSILPLGPENLYFVGPNGYYSLVGADTGGFESLGAQLFVLIGNEVNAEREVVNTGTLAAKIEDPDLGVGDTTVEPGLGIRLEQRESISLLVRYSVVS